MKNKLNYFIYGLFLVSFNSIAVDVSYSTFKLSEEMYGVYVNIVFDSKFEKTAAASLEIDDSSECGGILRGLNENNTFFIKKYLVENIEEIELNSNPNLFWIIKVNNSKCFEQSTISINLIVEEYDIGSNLTSSSKPIKVDDIKITNLKINNFKYPVTLNKNKVNQQLQGIVNWGEVDNFSNYGRLYFKFIWNNEVGSSPYKQISDYQLECLTNNNKLITNHKFLMKPSLVKLPSFKNQTIHLFPLIFKQGEEDEYFERCDATVVYEYKGISYKTLGVWTNDMN